MEVRRIPISKIVTTENSRTDYKKGEIEDLMSSIKQDGLLQPIGVCELEDGTFELVFGNRRYIATKKLGLKSIDANVLDASNVQDETDLMVINLIENEQRSNISDLEKGRYFQELKKPPHHMTESQIAVRLGIGVTKVKQCISLHNHVPQEFRKKVVTKNKPGGKKNGNIPTSLANQIVNAVRREGISSSNKEKLFNWARQDEITTAHLKMAMKLIATGSSFEKARKSAQKVKMLTVEIPVLIEDFEELAEQYNGTYGLKKEVVQSLYGETDQIVFSRPY